MRGFGDPGERKSGSGRPKGEHTPTRTVYVLAAGAAKPQPVKVKTGITDGITTEIVEGLSEGDKIVTAALTPNKPAAGAPSSPFGGGMRFR
jgi:HlyD family secretion protein